MKTHCILAFLLSSFMIGSCYGEKRSPINYKFAVAGHAYGSHHDSNPALYPKFIDAFTSKAIDYSFIIFAGDQVRKGGRRNTDILFSQLDELRIPYYLTRGNHDNGSYLIGKFNAMYSSTYYSFQRGSEKFIILDCIENRGHITGEQLDFLEKELENSPTDTKNIFVVMHELIWLAEERYGLKQVEHNLVDSYHGIYENGTNFWNDVFPLLKSTGEDTHVYVIAGDVGGGPDTISAYFAQVDNVTFLATGMGETIDENFMEIAITENGEAIINLVPLDSWIGRLGTVISRAGYNLKKLVEKVVWQLRKTKIDDIENY